ncbi:MAG TPA: hypothetical protein VK183_13160 [Flavobacterium sp.]|nr:hypothetical protein [Flavobacterium sp.]
MKKLLIIGFALGVLTSCGCQSWSCRKRYVQKESGTTPLKKATYERNETHPA